MVVLGCCCDRGGWGELVVVGIGTRRASVAVPAEAVVAIVAGDWYAGQHEWCDMTEYEEEE